MDCRCMEFVAEERRGSAIYFVWIERLKIEVNGSCVDVSLKRVVSVVLVLWGVGPVLRNGYGN